MNPQADLNPVAVEEAIRVCSNRIAKSVDVVGDLYEKFLDADRRYDQAWARAYLSASGPAHEKKPRAELQTARERADRDVAEIRGEIRDFRQATTSSVNAMRADFTDLRREFTELQQRVDNGFAEMRGRFDATAAGQQHIVDLLTTIMNEQGGDT